MSPNETHDDKRIADASKPTAGTSEQMNRDKAPVPVGINRDAEPQFHTEQPDDNVHSANVHGKTLPLRRKYLASYASYYSAGVNKCTVTIRGNPALLAQMAPPLMPHSVEDYKREIGRLQVEAEAAAVEMTKGKGGSLANSSMNRVTPSAASPTTLPLLVKIRARTPVFDDAGQIIGTEPFWYEDWYMCQSIDTVFSGGQFTQTLKLIAMQLGGSPNG